ncbi:MAG: tRNA preQ1(34) S-adenosylmethionine ribosyltransferase-isomerase QueA [Deltaproteobacteria bacterium]|nr:tRNA preQ1(34) S-adenosylmethionine ribosyltransferase-isomerase QueA [Deltaproteobacteria bacterium]
MYRIEDYDYDLPEHLIAQVPAGRRDESRLLVVGRRGESLSDRLFFDLPRLLRPGDLLVVNNSRVVPARLFGRKESGGRIEILVLEHDLLGPSGNNTRWCLLKSSKRPSRGSRLLFDSGISAVVQDLGRDGLVRVTFQGTDSIDAHLEERGKMPLPPYIRRRSPGNALESLDRERYQTVFSREKGAVAAPTAGLHFTGELVEALNRRGVGLAELTLHVGHGTFRPVRTYDIRNHRLGEEAFVIDARTSDAIRRCRKDGGRIIAVGTTVVRTLESVADTEGAVVPCGGKTDLLITPGFQFRVLDGMITNFHLPRSSLLFLVSAFAGLELTRKAYQWAIDRQYRFYSYGDAMLIL